MRSESTDADLLQRFRSFALQKPGVTESLACKGTVIQSASFKVKGNSCRVTIQRGCEAGVQIEFAGLAALIAAFSCVDDLADCENLMIPEYLGRQVGYFLSSNHPKGTEGQASREARRLRHS